MTSVRGFPARALDAVLRAQLRWSGITHVATHSFLDSRRLRAGWVIDGGAHVGEFSLQLRDRYDCHCVAIEPISGLAARIPVADGLRVLVAALADTPGEVSLHISRNLQATSLHPEIADVYGRTGLEVAQAVTLDRVIGDLGIDRVALLKLDIEGAETAVLLGAPSSTLALIDQVTVEFHDFVPGVAATPAVLSTIARMRREGFRPMAFTSPWGHHGDTLFVHPRRLGLAGLDRLNLAILDRLTLPLRRRLEDLRRWFG